MAHLVRHRTPAGDTATHEVDDLDAAVARVERLRNDDHAEDVRVFAEVPLQFETYVRVTVVDAPSPTADTPPEPPVADVESVDVGSVDVESVVDEPASAPPAPPIPPPPGVLAPVRVDAPSANADELVDATPVDARKGLFHRGSPSA